MQKVDFLKKVDINEFSKRNMDSSDKTKGRVSITKGKKFLFNTINLITNKLNFSFFLLQELVIVDKILGCIAVHSFGNYCILSYSGEISFAKKTLLLCGKIYITQYKNASLEFVRLFFKENKDWICFK